MFTKDIEQNCIQKLFHDSMNVLHSHFLRVQIVLLLMII